MKKIFSSFSFLLLFSHLSVEATPAYSINYANQFMGTFYQATISCTEGDCQAVWTADTDGDQEQREVELSESDFLEILGSISSISDFANSVVSEEMHSNFIDFHLIAITAVDDAAKDTKIYKIPVKDPSPEFVDWLYKIGYQPNEQLLLSVKPLR